MADYNKKKKYPVDESWDEVKSKAKATAAGAAAGAALDYYLKKKHREKLDDFIVKYGSNYGLTWTSSEEEIESAMLAESQKQYNIKAHQQQGHLGQVVKENIKQSLIMGLILGGVLAFFIVAAQDSSSYHSTSEFAFHKEYAPGLPYLFWFVLSTLWFIGSAFYIQRMPGVDLWALHKPVLRGIMNFISTTALILFALCIILFYAIW